jgi:CRP-like cAMP-binding protein
MTGPTTLVHDLRERRDARRRIEALRACGLFDHASDRALTELAAGALRLSVEPGQVLVRQGEPADAVYVVVEGRVEVIVGDGTGAGASSDVTAGGWFGELGLVERSPRSATVTTVTTTTLLRLDGWAFLRALSQSRSRRSVRALG